MSVPPESKDNGSATVHQGDALECPRCRRPVEGNGRRANGHCPVCGLRMVRSVRQSEVDAWQALYGGQPRGLRGGPPG